MKRTNLIVFSSLLLLLRCSVSSTQATYNTSIRLETPRGGESTILGTPVGETYADWGSILSQTGRLDSVDGQPEFRDGYYGGGLFVRPYRVTYPPGANTIADFTEPAYSVFSDAGTAYTETVIMLTKDPNDRLIGGAASAPATSAPGTYRTGTYRTGTTGGIVPTIPMAKIERWPSRVGSDVQLENLYFEAPEPTTLLLLGLGRLMLRKRDK